MYVLYLLHNIAVNRMVIIEVGKGGVYQLSVITLISSFGNME